ncbi:hypothetical protein L1987_53888 [Smallanthus sonchifolius]|uniref:Uncharacterized protein n=1 Tax=Smallanthus sonchifolius TaxID=185202 RepID=A0ACB9EX36_9ASTR|nr:hypothetical protein L1987_53888 [Smallanthus sonchifolius]
MLLLPILRWCIGTEKESILGLSMPSSFLFEEVQERQIGLWKTDGMPDNYGDQHSPNPILLSLVETDPEGALSVLLK